MHKCKFISLFSYIFIKFILLKSQKQFAGAEKVGFLFGTNWVVGGILADFFLFSGLNLVTIFGS